MCLGQIAKVVAAHGDRRAPVETDGVRREVMDLVDPGEGSLVRALSPGDWVVVHSGFALDRITAAEAVEALRIRGYSAPEMVPATDTLAAPEKEGTS